jgi:hypothetical protein
MWPVSVSRGGSVAAFTHRSDRLFMSPPGVRSRALAAQRAWIRALNYMLAIFGVLMMLWDFFTYVQYTQEVYHFSWEHTPTRNESSGSAHPRGLSRLSTAMMETHLTFTNVDLPSIARVDDPSCVQSDGVESATSLPTGLRYINLDKGRCKSTVLA